MLAPAPDVTVCVFSCKMIPWTYLIAFSPLMPSLVLLCFSPYRLG
jgi:hypothetical protein